MISDDPFFHNIYSEILTAVGARPSEPVRLDFQIEGLRKKANLAAVILHIHDWKTKAQDAFVRLERFCTDQRIPLLLRLNLDDLDDVLAQSSYTEIEYLLSDSPAELLVSLQTRLQKSARLVFTDRDELDVSDLKKISADVERIARALVQLSGPDTTAGERPPIPSPFIEPHVERSPTAKVSDAPVTFKAQDSSILEPLGKSSGTEQTPPTFAPDIARASAQID